MSSSSTSNSEQYTESHLGPSNVQNHQTNPKFLGDISSVASFFSALSANKALIQQQQQRHMPVIPNFQQQLAQAHAQALNSLQQQQQQQHDLTNSPINQFTAAAMTNGFKFNPFANAMHEQTDLLQKQQQQMQQNYTSSLAKFMALCQDNYMQRLIAEKYE